MTAPLHERLDDVVNWLIDAHEFRDGGSVLRTVREAAAALRPPEGEVGALCERLRQWAEDCGGQSAADLRAALAHLRRLAAVEAEVVRLAHAYARETDKCYRLREALTRARPGRGAAARRGREGDVMDDDNDPLPEITQQQFLSCVATDRVCDDDVLSARTLRMVLRDYRDHARRLLGTDARRATPPRAQDREAGE